MTTRRIYRYPLAGHVDLAGFPAFLGAELSGMRGNLRRFAAELREAFTADRVTLVNSGASAALAAACALAEQTGGGGALASGLASPTMVAALGAAGFQVTLVDTEPDGFHVDLEALEAAITPSTRVICVDHFLGFPAPIDEIHELAARQGLVVLQDCSASMDLRVGGGPAHRRGTLATWSFGPGAPLAALGGGAVVSLDETWHRRVESLVHEGRACTCHAERLACHAPEGPDHLDWFERQGFDLEMSELNAAFGRWQLRSFREQEDRRRRHYRRLSNALARHVALRTWPTPEDSGSPAFFPLYVREGDPEDIQARLRAREVEVRSLSSAVVNRQPAFRNLPSDGLKKCLHFASSTFVVSIHQSIREDHLAEVARLIFEEAIL